MRADRDERPLVVVDASNVALSATWRAAHPGEDRGGLQRRLVDLAASWATAEDVDLLMAFDGIGPYGDAGERRVGPRCQVVATGPIPADDLVERRVREAKDGRRTAWLVTSDVAIRETVAASSERQWRADEFADDLLAYERSVQESTGPAAKGSPDQAQDRRSPLAETLDEHTKARLERLRRGE